MATIYYPPTSTDMLTHTLTSAIGFNGEGIELLRCFGYDEDNRPVVAVSPATILAVTSGMEYAAVAHRSLHR